MSSQRENYLHKGMNRISGLTQLLSKRPDQFAPGVWPTYYSKAHGMEIWDIDNNQYIDMSISGIGANVLGYCDVDVDAAVIDIIKKGNSSSLNCVEEIELAELLCELHPWANKVRYARTGGEALAVAVRISRAATGRDKVAFCGYHGWHDWYIAANLIDQESLTGHLLPGLSPNGVPKALAGTALPFAYNKIDDLINLFEKNPNEIGTVVMEPIRSIKPEDEFLSKVKNLCRKYGAVLIFDEVSSGFRIANGGAHLSLGVNPDIAVFAKALSNGYPMAAVIGIDSVMAAVGTTFISSTYWTDRVGPVAALATIRKFIKNNVSEYLQNTGLQVQNIWKNAAMLNDLKIDVYGIAPMSYFSFKEDNDRLMITYFIQEMLKHGFLASSRFYASYAHTQNQIDKFEVAVNRVFRSLSSELGRGNLLDKIKGDVSKPGFSRLN